MSITPADIQQQRFSEAKRGYNPGEVDVFLETLAAEVDAMLRKIADLKGRLNNAEKQLAGAQAQLAHQAQAQQAAPTPQALPQANTTGATEQQISKALIAAQQSADRIVSDAQHESSRIREEADGKAREVIRQALQQKQDEFDEIERLKESREEFRASYMKLIQHFLDDANAVFPEAMLVQPTPTGSEASRKSSVVQSSASASVQPAQAQASTPQSVPADKTVLSSAVQPQDGNVFDDLD